MVLVVVAVVEVIAGATAVACKAIAAAITRYGGRPKLDYPKVTWTWRAGTNNKNTPTLQQSSLCGGGGLIFYSLVLIS